MPLGLPALRVPLVLPGPPDLWALLVLPALPVPLARLVPLVLPGRFI